jgi:putative phosphoribosyl transferase
MSETLVHVSVPNGNAAEIVLEGNLTLPDEIPMPRGIVLFAHGSGSSRHSPRNRYVAATLNQGGFATLLLDLLTLEEERIDQQTRHLRFDIALLARRLIGAMDWLEQNPQTLGLNIGIFGASTGAAAALIAAAQRPNAVQAVVSRGGRPDLAGEMLSIVRTPTLLIVGGEDKPVIAMNEEALAHLRSVKVSEKQLMIVPGATHLFQEAGTLEQVAHLAREWFAIYLVGAQT